MKTECIYCGSRLERCAEHAHWAYCPACEPANATRNRDMIRLFTMDVYARAAVADRRGHPTRGGRKES